MIYWKRFVGDFRAKTATLSALEIGVYDMMLDECYATEKPLPADTASLFRLCRAFTEAEQQAVIKIRDKFFRRSKHGLFNKRVNSQIASERRYLAHQSKAGKISAAKRLATAVATGGPTQSQVPQPQPYLKTTSSHRSVGSRLPQDWNLSTDLEAEARTVLAKAGRNGIDIPAEAEKFRDYWHAKAGAQARKVDWIATWRNWIRNAKPNGAAAHGSHPNRKLSLAEETERGLEALGNAERH